MERNFKVQLNGVEVERQGKLVDVHNFYDLRDVFFSLVGGILSVVFSRNDVKPVAAIELPREIVFSCFGVHHFEISDGVLAGKAEELEEIGFKEPEDNDLDWLATEEQASKTSHVILRFHNDEYIRVGSETAYFS